MRKLLFFIDTGLSGGGAERVLCNLVNALDSERFDVTVMTLWPQDPSPYLLPHVHYRSLYPRHDRLTHILYRLEAAAGLTCRRIRDAFDIEVAYLEFGPTKVLSSSKHRAKKVAWVHCDLEKTRSDTDALARACAPWYRKFDHVVCVSENVRESFCRLFPDAPPATVLYNINDEREILRKADAFPVSLSDVPTLCAVGRLTRQKNFSHLIRTCARLKDLPFRLQIIGEGEDRPMLESLIAETGLGDRVELLGWQSNPYPYMKAADLIVCSSLYEGLSTVVTEALILGKAVVTTPCTGMAELLGDSEHGLIAGEDADALHRALRRMLTEPGLPERYAAAALRRGGDFRRAELVRKTEAFFTVLMGGTRSE